MRHRHTLILSILFLCHCGESEGDLEVCATLIYANEIPEFQLVELAFYESCEDAPALDGPLDGALHLRAVETATLADCITTAGVPDGQYGLLTRASDACGVVGGFCVDLPVADGKTGGVLGPFDGGGCSD